MERLITLVVASVFSLSQAPTSVLPTAWAAPRSPGAADRLSDADLEELLAPIALYPDPLLANVLAAACYPDELAKAGSSAGNAALIDAADWEPSVKAVAKIPDTLTMLTQYPDWTAAVGEAFILQSPDVMSAVQRLRARAYANGALQTTPQQVVRAEGDTIIIQPAQPDVIYVPMYQPSVVYVHDSSSNLASGVIGFGQGITAGLIIANNIDCDWHGGGCCYGCGGGWGHTDVDININNNNNININNIKNNGNQWKANNSKISSSLREGRPQAMNSYRGVGSGRADAGRVPGRQAGARPISDRAAPRPSQSDPAATGSGRSAAAPARPQSQPMQRPESMQRPETPRAKPSIPPASNRPSVDRPQPSSGASRAPARQPSRPSAYSGGGTSTAASRGATSRGGGSAGGSGRR